MTQAPDKTSEALESQLMAFMSDPDARTDPYPFYSSMRGSCPVHRSDTAGMWFVTSHASASELVRDHRLWSSDARTAGAESPAEGTARRVMSEILAFRDAPDHPRLRRLINRTFTVTRAENRRASIRQQIDGMIEARRPAGRMEFVEEIARELPLTMISDAIGMPLPETPKVRRWVDAYVSMLDPNISPELEAVGDQVFAEFLDDLLPLLDERRTAPREDILTDLVQAQEEGHLTLQEVGAYALFLFVAGHESTTFMLANGLYMLLTHRSQWELLCSDPEGLKARVVEEVLRYDSPSRVLFPRYATQDHDLEGQSIKRGDMVLGANSAANRDPDVFERPDEFDVLRPNSNQHLAFGGGAHMCSGAALARTEGQEVFAALATALPDLQLDGPVEWAPTWILRAVEQVPLRWTV